jgi:hypothetical protein
VVVGRTYRITGSCIAFKNTTGDFNIAHIKVMSGASNTGTKYAESYAQHQFTTGSIGAAGTYTVPVYIPGSVFTAVSSTVYIHVILGSSMRIDAGTGDRSWMLLEELPLHTQTSEWT